MPQLQDLTMTMINKKLLLTVIILTGTLADLTAQENDFQAWGGIGAVVDITKKIDIEGSYELRYQNNAQEFDVSYFSASTGYKISKHLSAGADIRYGTNKVWDRFRYGLSLGIKKGVKNFQFSGRLKYEYEHFIQTIPEIGQFPSRNNFRVRLQAEYKWRKNVKLFISTEPLYRITDHKNFVQRIRNIAGTSWEFYKNHALEISWYYQPEYTVAGIHDFTAHILSVAYTWSIPKASKKAKTTDSKVKK